jgi:hypothetical protein
MLDKIGQEITPGSIIAYGHALGRCAGLRIGKVLAVATKMEEKWGREYEVDRITIRGVDGEWVNEKPKLLTKKSTLQFPDRCIVLDPTKIKSELKELLDTVELENV